MPPVAVSVVAGYATPTSPSGNAVVEIVRGLGGLDLCFLLLQPVATSIANVTSRSGAQTPRVENGESLTNFFKADMVLLLRYLAQLIMRYVIGGCVIDAS